VDLNYSTYALFPSIVHCFDVNGFNETQNELIDYAYEQKKKDPKGVKVSNRGGWQSSYFDLEYENDLLQSFLINCLSEFPTIKKSVNFTIDYWININSPGSYNVKHDHPTASLAGVLWIKAPKNSGNIVFENPTAFQSHLEIHSYVTDIKEKLKFYEAYTFPPIDGRILIFPAHLKHSVEENMSKENRISVSFNMRFKNEN